MVGTSQEGYLPFGGGDQKVQEFQALKDDVKSTLLYLRSGSAVTPQEYTRLSRLLPQLLRRKEVDKAQLQRFKSEFQTILTELQAGKRGPAATEPGTGEDPEILEFGSEEEAAAAGLAPGTQVSINGKMYVWEDE